MGRASRLRKSGVRKGMYDILRQEKETVGYYNFTTRKGKEYIMALNPLKHILMLKKYKDQGAKALMDDTYKQYKAFLAQHADDIKNGKIEQNVIENAQEKQ